MPTRTYLTTPPGRSASEARERYVPGLAAPVEPRAPSRWRGSALVVAGVVLVALVTVVVLRLTAASQAQDPSLDPAASDPAAGAAAARDATAGGSVD